MDEGKVDMESLEPESFSGSTLEPSTYCTPSFRQQRLDSEGIEDKCEELCKDFSPSHKLDVLTSKKINRFITFILIVIVFTFIHVSALSSLCNTVWHDKTGSLGSLGKKMVVSTCRPSLVYMKVLLAFDIFWSTVLIILAIAFAIRIIRTKMKRNPQQIWALFLVVTSALSYNPLGSIFTFKDPIFEGNQVPDVISKVPSLMKFLEYNRAFVLATSSVGQFYYLWTSSHHYGILNEDERPGPFRFYGPKVLVLTLYSISRIIMTLKMRISPSSIPLATLAGMISNCRAIGEFPLDLTLKVGLYTVFELAIFAAIVRNLFCTAKILQKARYLKYRSKQVGFRFFIMTNFVVYLLFIIADSSIILSVPRYWEVKYLLSFPYKYVLFNYRFSPVPRILDYTIIFITAYVNLPADSFGFMGWFKAKTWGEEEEEPEMIGLKTFDDDPNFNLQQMSTRMIYELHVHLFNASDLACGANSPRSAMVSAGKSFLLNSGYIKELEILNETNETYVMVLGSSDRIVIAFKGASSVGNMKGDMNMKMTRLSDFIPSNKDSKHKALSSLYWKKACIHKGFAAAYASISSELLAKISELREVNKRPVFFTGHSLGAALATLCSLDVVLSLDISDICVSTFGSPRCGNIFWAKIYDQLVIAHWRIEVRSDLITTLPGKEYSHVGKRAALYKTGELFLDPNAIEVLLWPSDGVHLADHRKPVYKQALASFSSKYLPGFTPSFISGTNNAAVGVFSE